MLPRSCSPIECEISRSLSQNCAARVFEIRPSVAVEGDDQSVNSTGSHTMKGRTACLEYNLESTPESRGQNLGTGTTFPDYLKNSTVADMAEPYDFEPVYSYRSAVTGSTAVARLAGP